MLRYFHGPVYFQTHFRELLTRVNGSSALSMSAFKVHLNLHLVATIYQAATIQSLFIITEKNRQSNLY